MTDERGEALSPEGPDDQVAPGSGRNSEPLTLALIGLGVAVLLLAASAIPVILSRGDDDAGSSSSSPVAQTGPVATSPSTVGVSAAPGSTVRSPAPATSEAAATTPSATTPPGTEPTTTQPGTEPATTEPTTTEPTTTEPTTSSSSVPPAGDVPESVAVVLGGKIYLEGAVPDEASRNEIVALATEIFTADNVIDNYIIDPRASDPNLGDVRIDDTILFAPDSAQIASDFEPLLNQGLALLTIRPATTFLIEGHTDSLGGESYNLDLSQQRADAIVGWYTDRGIDRARLTAIGKGEAEPIASDETRAGRDRNRRIEVTIENLLVDSG